MGQNWMKFGKIDRGRFFSVSGPRICLSPKKSLKKTIKIMDFWILARFWGITMDSENHGSWSHRFTGSTWGKPYQNQTKH